MSAKDDYLAMIQSQFRKWDAELDKLSVKAGQLSADARARYEEQLNAMRADRDAANRKLQDMRAAGESAWQHMRAGTDASWDSMKNALDRASSQFKTKP